MRSIFSILAILAILFVCERARSQGTDEEEPKQIFGTAYIRVNPSYTQVMVNDDSWEESYFLNDGATLVIERLEISQEWKIKISKEEYEDVELVISPKMWKKKLDKEQNVYLMIFENAVKLKKGSPKVPTSQPTTQPDK